ncbi:hypothetical protein DFP73DRAFT_529798 [Morchella snyderi]|nr:hypothetical protein DFP73DRAFT_529798 [Morchella snyderi]
MSHQVTDSFPAPLLSPTDSPRDATARSSASIAPSSASSTASSPDDGSCSAPSDPEGSRPLPPAPFIPAANLGCTHDKTPVWLNMDPATGDLLLIRAMVSAQVALAAYRLDSTAENREALMAATDIMFKRASEAKCKALREEGFPWYGLRYYFLVWFGSWEWPELLWIGLMLGMACSIPWSEAWWLGYALLMARVVPISVLIIKIYEGRIPFIHIPGNHLHRSYITVKVSYNVRVFF